MDSGRESPSKQPAWAVTRAGVALMAHSNPSKEIPGDKLSRFDVASPHREDIIGIQDEVMDMSCSIVQEIFGLERAIVFNYVV
ncbi:hypothetical protein FOYG_04044 [Fusarium oxysporum NRRL 32931]|uniref:Uncharacterized protein n=1 Tax=Fusarium oxysporum NRRL 32931 TaxID=660029 RepID=W9IJX0_FUSOX|nr:hypothetical protein FOYG_04044 [Fusarium oxysporum NRRL 32931]